jgi:hypothetical protein
MCTETSFVRRRARHGPGRSGEERFAEGHRYRATPELKARIPRKCRPAMSTQRFPLNSEKCHRHVYDQTPSLIEPQVF